MNRCEECQALGIFRCCCSQIVLCENCAVAHIQHLVLDISGNIESYSSVYELLNTLQGISEELYSLQELEKQLNEFETEKDLKDLCSKFSVLKSSFDIFDSIQPKMYFNFVDYDLKGIFEYNILSKILSLIVKLDQFSDQVVIEYPCEPAFLLFGGNFNGKENRNFFKYDLSENSLIKLEFNNFPEIFNFSFCVYGKFMFIVGGEIISESGLTGNKKIYLYSFEKNTVQPFIELKYEVQICVSVYFQGQLCLFEEKKLNQITVLNIGTIQKKVKNPKIRYLNLLDIEVNKEDFDFTKTTIMSATLNHIFLIIFNTLYRIDNSFNATKLLIIEDFYFIPNFHYLSNPEGLYFIGHSNKIEEDFNLSCLFLSVTEEDQEVSYNIQVLNFDNIKSP